MIKMALITPTSYLKQFASQSDGVHLCLAHLAKPGSDYVQFYESLPRENSHVICDNGAFELGESLSPAMLLDKAALFNPDTIVLPDYPGKDYRKTIEATISFLKDVASHSYVRQRIEAKRPIKWMFVPQSLRGDVSGWCEGYRWASEQEEISWIGMSILGIPNAWDTVPAHLSRYYCGEFLMTNNMLSQKTHHYLGSFGYPQEYPLLSKQGIAYSSDTSSPVWHGYHDIAFDRSVWGLIGGKLSSKVNFDAPMKGDATNRIIQYNIDQLKELAK